MSARARSYFTNISDRDVILILLGFFGGAVTMSMVARLLAIIKFERPFLDWAASLLEWTDSFFQNFGTEMFGAFLTFYLIEVLVGSRRTREADQREAAVQKQRLIQQMRSQVNSEAIRAVEELRVAGWLQDGSLNGVGLSGANLQTADLGDANLQEAYLEWANLQEAGLTRVNLRGAYLGGANLQEAVLVTANLEEAHLDWANLRGASLNRATLKDARLDWANLQGVYMLGANLQEAYLVEANLQEAVLEDKILGKAELNEETWLPDGSKWTSDTDMTRFTDADHPEFWRSNSPESPAYRAGHEDD